MALGSGIPVATTGLFYPLWAIVAMATSDTSLFVNSIGGCPRLLAALTASWRPRQSRLAPAWMPCDRSFLVLRSASSDDRWQER